MDDTAGLAIALEEAQAGYNEGGIPPLPFLDSKPPVLSGSQATTDMALLTAMITRSLFTIGAALVSKDGKLLGRGHNMRVQLGSPIHHGETSALYNSGRLPAKAYEALCCCVPEKGSTMYTTPSPCDMCTGACLLYGISRAVIGENKTFLSGEAYLKSRGVQVRVVDDPRCKALMDRFIEEKPELWNEDIGVEERVYTKNDLK